MGRFTFMADSMDQTHAGRSRLSGGLASGFLALFGATALASGSMAQTPTTSSPPSAATPVSGGAEAGPAAPAAPAAPTSGVVQKIDVEGNERIERDTILSYLSIQPGDTVSPEQIDLAIKTLFKTCSPTSRSNCKTAP
jgi:outer membrane protein assembly factor BamA